MKQEMYKNNSYEKIQYIFLGMLQNRKQKKETTGVVIQIV